MLHEPRLELRLGLSVLTLDRRVCHKFFSSFFLPFFGGGGRKLIDLLRSTQSSVTLCGRELFENCFSSATHCCNKSGERGRKGGGEGTKLCKTVAGLYFNLIHGSGNREDRPRRRWLKTRDVRELRSPGTRLAASPTSAHPLADDSPRQNSIPVFLSFHPVVSLIIARKPLPPLTFSSVKWQSLGMIVRVGSIVFNQRWQLIADHNE